MDKVLVGAEKRRKELLASKVAHTRAFHENRGKRVNSEGELVDGVVADLRPKKHSSSLSMQQHGKLLHRPSRGTEEVEAEDLIHQDEIKKFQVEQQVGGSKEMWRTPRLDTALHEVDYEDISESEEEEEDGGEEEGREENKEEENKEEEQLKETRITMLGPKCLRDLPEGRTSWYQLLSGHLPSDLLWKDLGHTIPLLELTLSHLNVEDRLLILLSTDGSKHRAIIKLHLRSCTKITDNGVVALESCKSIRDFDVCGCHQLTDVAFVSFARTHAELSRIHLSGCVLATDKAIGALAKGCRHLIMIEAAGLSLDDVALRAFAQQAKVPFSAKLQHVDLNGCTSATDGSMMSVLTGLGGAQHISIANAPMVTDVSLAPLNRSSFRTLRALDITNLNVGDAGVAWIAAGCNKGLRELNMRGCRAVTDVGIIALSESCTNLTCLSLAECVEVTDAAINRLVQSLGPTGLLNPYRKYTAKPKAKKRPIAKRRAGRRNVHHDEEDDEIVDKYIDIPSGLRILDLSDCSKLTDRCLQSIGNFCQALETLVLVGVNNITDVGLLHLGRMRARLPEQKLGHTQTAVSFNPLATLNVSGRFQVSNVGLNTYFGTARVTDLGVARMLKQGCGNRMVSLDLTGSAFVGDKTLKALGNINGGEGAVMLKKLSLSGCARITNVGVAALFSVTADHSSSHGDQGGSQGSQDRIGGKGCIALETLNVAGCPRIGDGALIALGRGTASNTLKKLNLFKCRNITDVGIRALGRCTALEDLNLRTCVNITDGGLIALASDPRCMEDEMYPCAPRLLTLNLAGLPEITSAGVAVVASRFTRLGRLDATGCVGVERRHLSRLVAPRDGVLRGACLASNNKSVSLVPAAPFIGLSKLHRYLELKTKQHLCAKQIQTAWMSLRSFRARLKQMIEEKMAKRRARKKAVLIIQRTVARGVAGRIKADKRRACKIIEDQARLDIQRCWRGHLGRTLAVIRRREVSALATLHWAMAIDIQRQWRGLLGRARYHVKSKQDTCATLRLQRWIREMWAKDEAKTLSHFLAKLKRIRICAATKIQMAWRGEKERERVHAGFVRLRHDTLTLQRWIRGTLSRWKTLAWRKDLTHACCVVQRAFRNHEARMVRNMLQKAKDDQKKLEHDSALLIQSRLVRPWFARRRIRTRRKMHHAAVLFQSAWHYFKVKRSRRVKFAMERLRKREQAVIEAKARELYEVWRVEDDAKPESLASRQRTMLESGAALVIQKLYRRGLIFKRLHILSQYKYHKSAIQIQSVLRGFWARSFVIWKKRVILLVTTRITKWWRQFPITYAYRNVKKLREAEQRRLMLIRKKELIQKAWNRRLASLLDRTKLRAVKLIQQEYRAYVRRRIAWEEAEASRLVKEAEIKAVEEYRIQAEQERKERKTFKGKMKAFKRFITNPKAIKKKLLPDQRQVDLAVNNVKAMFDPKLKEKLIRNEFESLMFSIQSRQKEAIAQTGVIDIALTVGEDEYKSFLEQQNLAKNEGRSYFVTSRVDLHSKHTKLSEGQQVSRPRFIFIWTMTSHDRTAHIITDIQIVKHPKESNSLKQRDYIDAVKKSGWVLKWHPKCKFEIKYHRNGRHMIRALQVVSNERQQAKLVKTGWEAFAYNNREHTKQGEEIIAGGEAEDFIHEDLDFGEFNYDAGTKLYIKHAMPKKNASALEAQYEAVKRSDGTYADISQDSMDHASLRRLLDQVEFAGYTAIDIDKLRTNFNKMDADGGGTVDVDEFFNYVKERRTVLSEHIFEFHGFEFGEHQEDEELDFGHFVKAITTLCMFDRELLVRFFFNMFDTENNRYILKTEARKLIEMFQHQAPGVCTKGQCERGCLMLGIIGTGRGQGIVTFDDFLELANSCPTVVYPILKLQHTMRTKFLGIKYWERKLDNMRKARELVFQARHEGADLTSGDVTGRLLNLSSNKDQKKATEKRKKKLQKWKAAQKKGKVIVQ